MRAAGKRRVLLVLDDLPAGVGIPAAPRGNASILVTARAIEDAAPGVRVLEIGKGPEVAGVPPDRPPCRGLWRAMSVCRPGGFPLDLAARIAAVGPADLPQLCAHLIQRRLVDPVDDSGAWLRLGLARHAPAPESLENERRCHAEAVIDMVSGRGQDRGLDPRVVPEIMPAFRWASGADWKLACGLARRAFAAFRGCGRLAEGAELLIAFRDAADGRGDWQVSDECAWELSWIRGVPYRGSPRAPAGEKQLSLDFGP